MSPAITRGVVIDASQSLSGDDTNGKVRRQRGLVFLGNPSVGNDVSGLIRELAALDGIRRVVPLSKVPRLLVVHYDQSVIGARTLVARARRGWAAARRVGVCPREVGAEAQWRASNHR